MQQGIENRSRPHENSRGAGALASAQHATGERKGQRQSPDGTTTYTYEQGDVHDFAWTACPEFVEYREKYVLGEPRVETEMILLIMLASGKAI